MRIPLNPAADSATGSKTIGRWIAARYSKGCRPPIPRGLGKVAGFTSQSVAAFRRNGWPTCVGISGGLGSEYAAARRLKMIGLGVRKSCEKYLASLK